MTGERDRFMGEQPQVSDVLEPLVSTQRIARIDSVLANRVVSITAVFEDIYDPHNVGACMRTCDAYGLQDIHVITAQHGYRPPSSITMSAHQWLTLHKHETTQLCLDHLRQQGFSLWVSDLQADRTLAELPVEDHKVAIVIGNEAEGVSERMAAAADHRFVLPMHGMVQSFNLSVALAICLDELVPQRRSQLGGLGDMPAQRQRQLRRDWLEYGIRDAKAVRKAYGDER